MSKHPSVIVAADRLFSYQEAKLAELRAILRPLLEKPYIDSGPMSICRLCEEEEDTYESGISHKPDCPVLRKDELLGRA